LGVIVSHHYIDPSLPDDVDKNICHSIICMAKLISMINHLLGNDMLITFVLVI